MTKLLYRDNDNLITVEGLRNIIEGGGYLNASTVEANLYDEDGNLITPSGGITLTYVSGSNGNYEGVIQSTTNLPIGQNYLLFIDSSEAGAVGHWEIECEVVERKS